VIALLFFVGAVAFGVVAARGTVGAKGLSYDFAHHALLLARGRIADIPPEHLNWPPGYPIAMAPLIWLGVVPLRAAWIVSLVAFGATVSITFLLGQRLSRTAIGIAGALLLLLNADLLQWSAIPLSEMLCAASILSSLLAFDGLLVRWSAGSEVSRGRAIWTGVALAAPVWVRYIGIVVPFLTSAYLVVLLAVSRRKPARALLVLISAILVVGMIPLRNILMGGHVSGHPVGVLPADTLWSAISETLRGIRTTWFFLAERLPRTGVDVATGLLLIGIALWNTRRGRWSVASWLPVVYLCVLCWIASHTRIDKLNARFIVPIVPLVMLTALLGLYDAMSRQRVGWLVRTVAAGVAVVAVVVGGISVSRGVTLLVRGYSSDSDHAVATIAYIQQHVPPGVVLAVNERQIEAHTLAYREVVMPWVEPGEDSWTQAFGISPWTRAEALRAFLDQHIRVVALFLGPSGDYRWLAQAYPGDYVAKTMVTESLPEVASVERLVDGIVITLADPPKIEEALRQATQDRKGP